MNGKTFPANFAGEFVDRPFFDRVNPFTPFHSKKFKPNEQGQLLIDKYEDKYGKKIHVLPTQKSGLGTYGNPESSSESTLGYFNSRGIGGSFDPFNRYVYLNPSANQIKNEKGEVIDTKPAGTFVLAHELGHAFDSNLRKNPYRGELPSGVKRFAGGLIDALTFNKTDLDKRSNYFGKEPNFKSRAEAYEYYGKEAMNKFKKEIDAQKAAKDFFDENKIDDATASGYKAPLDDYPATYLHGYDMGITDSNFAQGIGGLNPIIREYEEASPDGSYNPGVRAVQKSVDSDEDLKTAQNKLFEQARSYAKEKGLYSGSR